MLSPRCCDVEDVHDVCHCDTWLMTQEKERKCLIIAIVQQLHLQHCQCD